MRKINFHQWLRAAVCLLLCVNIFSAVMPRTALAQSEETDETEARLVISSAEDFLKFSEDCRLDSYSRGLLVELSGPIDLTDRQFDGIPTFGGVFDGCGYEISGLSIGRSGSVQGLFRYVQESAVVRNLSVSGQVAPGGTHNYVGGIAGINAGTIENCSFSGKVSGADCVAGIAGRNEVTGIIDSCGAYGDIHADHFVGGIAGENIGVIRDCDNYARVNTVVEQNTVELSDITLDSLTSSEAAVVTTDIGGIAGTSDGVIRDCGNYGAVGHQHIGYNIGGVAGRQSGYIVDCVNRGEILGRKEVGGIVGQMEPSTVILYRPDTIQILEGQLSTLSGLIDNTAGNAQGTASELAGQMTQMQEHLENAQDALDQLVPGEGAEPPDEDSTAAALNSLSGSINAMTGIVSGMAATSEESIGVLANDINALVSQMGSIGQTIADSSGAMGGTVSDASDADTEEDISGKVADCSNFGYVQADLNAGGIAGSMALENNLDPESDIQILGSSSLNYDCEARAVVLRCDNHGTVSAKRQNVGGIAGLMLMGLVRDSVNAGRIDAPAAKYVGGIAGRSVGFIRQCSTKCVLDGGSYVGGIAGEALLVTDCRSMPVLDGGSEKTGAIIGYTEDIFAADEEEEQPVARNYYIPVGDDVGGIDGISYFSAAESLSGEAFFALEDLPRIFRVVTVKFIFEDETERSIYAAQGGQLDRLKIPAVPEKEGYVGCWDGLAEFDMDNVSFDTVFRLSYTPLDSTLQSENTRENGLPVLIVHGVFEEGSTLSLSETDSVPSLGEKQTLVEAWEVSLNGCDSESRLRYLIPEGQNSGELTLMVMNAGGQWEKREGVADGSYLVFSADGSEKGIALIHTPESYLVEMIAAGAAILVVITAVVVFVIRRRKSKANEEQ